MAWVKIPAEHHPLFLAALPKDPRISTIQMFGGIAAKVNGYMFGGLFARSAIVRLSAADQRTALALDGAAPFDPMGNGRVMMDTIALPEDVMDEPAQLRDWLARALEFTTTLPPKDQAKPRSRPASKPGPAQASVTAKPSPARAKPATTASLKAGMTGKTKAKPARAKPATTASLKAGTTGKTKAKPARAKPPAARAKSRR